MDEGMRREVLFSAGKDMWETPLSLLDPLHQQHGFTLDAAADAASAKCPWWFGSGSATPDALAVEWPTDQSIWLNPPYSKGAQRKFVDKAVECAKGGGKVMALLPARTDTLLFHVCIWNTSANRPRDWVREVRFLKGRVKFVDPLRVGETVGAPFPSMLVWFEV